MRLDTSVIIVGAGPTGLSLALALGRLGLDTVIVERRAQRSQHPRAHYVNTRTMELFRLWGVDQGLMPYAYPAEHMPFQLMAMIGGPTLEERDRMSPVRVTSCSQDVVERELERAALATGHTTILWNAECRAVADLGDHMAVTVRTADGDQTIHSRWCAAADGAHSPIRKMLGIKMIGHENLGSILNVYFHGRLSPDGETPPLGMPSSSPDIRGAFISMDGAARWCFQWIYQPGELDPSTIDAETCVQAILTAGHLPSTTAIDVRSIRPWTMTALVAEKMRLGSVFLVGDAAHAFPPTGGFGMNSGIADAHNLAWKLRAVADGIAGESLLASYEPERQPVAFLNTAQSFRNHKTQNLSREKSSDNELTEMLSVIEPFATRSVRSSAADATDDETRDRIEMLEHYAATGQELGYAYDRSHIITHDGVPRPDITVSRYIINASPGARAPHFEVIHKGARKSLLDMFDGRLTLLTGQNGDGWRQAADTVPSCFGLQLLTIRDGQDASPLPEWDIKEVFGIQEDGAVIVRPDGHVSFRAASAFGNLRQILWDAIFTTFGESAPVLTRNL